MFELDVKTFEFFFRWNDDDRFEVRMDFDSVLVFAVVEEAVLFVVDFDVLLVE